MFIVVVIFVFFFFFFKPKGAYGLATLLEFCRVLFRSVVFFFFFFSFFSYLFFFFCVLDRKRVGEGKGVDLGGGRINKKKKKNEMIK